RLYYMTFHGAFRGTEEQAAHVHESPKSMTVPLMVLAAGSCVAGLLGIPAALGGGNAFEHFLEPAFEAAHHALALVFPAREHPHSLEYGLMGASIAIAAAGILLATFLYKIKPALSAALASGLAPVH